MSHAGGRRSKLTGHVIAEASEYVDGPTGTICDAVEYLQSCVPKFTKRKRVAGIPTVEGLALHLNISRDTLYRWAKDNAAFGYIVERLNLKQADQTIQESAVGNYAPKIAAMILAKHGYAEKFENDNNETGNIVVKVVNYAEQGGTDGSG